MKQVNTIVKSPYEVDNTEGLWLDTSNPDAPVLKVLSNGSWKVLGTAKEVLDTFEVKSNKATTIDESSTDSQYASAKAVYSAVQEAGGTDIPIISGYNWASCREDGYTSSGLTKGEAIEVLGITEEEFDVLVSSSLEEPNPSDHLCFVWLDGYFLPEYRVSESAVVAYPTSIFTTIYIIEEVQGEPQLQGLSIEAMLPASSSDPVLYNIYGAGESPA